MFVLKPKEMREVDRYTIDEIGISSYSLMQKAAYSMYEEIKELNINSVSIFAGKGNNGADSLILAKFLIEDGYDTFIYLLEEIKTYVNEARSILDDLLNINANILVFDDEYIKETDIIIDGMFGTGFHGVLPNKYNKCIKLINEQRSIKIAVDIPSGLNGEDGSISSECVKADMTISFGAPKTGFFQGYGPKMIGELIIKDIGFPKGAFDQIPNKIKYIDKEFIENIIPKRDKDSNKGDHGKTLIIAGSKNMPGAGILSCRAAYKTGAGYVYYLTENENLSIYADAIPEALSANDISTTNYNSIAIGPGMGLNTRTSDLLSDVLKTKNVSVVIDADALNSIHDISILKKRDSRSVLTPHPKELSRLIDMPIEQILSDRINICRKISMEYGGILIIKGRNTVISNEKGELYINSTGNEALAKAGSGDILTGMIAGFSASMELEKAVILSVYLHGACADEFINENSKISLEASDLLEILPRIIKRTFGY